MRASTKWISKLTVETDICLGSVERKTEGCVDGHHASRGSCLVTALVPDGERVGRDSERDRASLIDRVRGPDNLGSRARDSRNGVRIAAAGLGGDERERLGLDL